MRATFRGARLILHLFTGVALVLLVTLDWSGRITPEPLTRWWNARLLKILNVRLRVRGQRPRGARLIVCNHISWLDISVIAASDLTRFVSKAEVASWPIAGWLANAAGTFYIRRGAGGTKQLTQALRYGRAANGENIAAFVGEETLTHNLRRLLRERELTVELTWCAPIHPQAGQDRTALAQAAHAAICAVVAPGQLPAATREAEERESLAA